MEAGDGLDHLRAPPLGPDLLSSRLPEGNVEGHSLAERPVRQIEVGQQQAVVEERRAHAGAERHDELHTVALDDGSALHVGVIDHQGRQVEGMGQGVGQVEALPLAHELGVGRAAVLPAREGRDLEDDAAAHQSGEADGHAVIARERSRQLDERLDQ